MGPRQQRKLVAWVFRGPKAKRFVISVGLLLVCYKVISKNFLEVGQHYLTTSDWPYRAYIGQNVVDDPAIVQFVREHVLIPAQPRTTPAIRSSISDDHAEGHFTRDFLVPMLFDGHVVKSTDY